MVVEAAPDALIATSPDGCVLYWNHGAEATFGYTSQEATGRTLNELIVPKDRCDEEQAILNSALETDVVTYESVRSKKDGSLIYLNVSTRAVLDANQRVQCFVYSKKDVTHLKVLRDSKMIEARYRDLLESTPDAIVILNNTAASSWPIARPKESSGMRAGSC